MKTPSFIFKKTLRGFTLPEVIVAIGIAALGLISLLGLMPRSLDMLRQAGEVTSESRIAQQIIAGVSVSDWQDAKGGDELRANYDGKRYYFDDLAVELGSTPEEFDVAYVAEVSVASADVALPSGSTAAASPDPNLRRVTVRVANTGVQNFDFASARAGAFRIYASVISRTGK